jgi:uncharacterized SAM-binding protein YcdF (DUF218 family)
VAERVRVVAVLGYSRGPGGDLHPVCAHRLRHAEKVAAGSRAVVLSGWSRARDGRGEAELMRDDWAGPRLPLICDTTARSTVENAAAVARASQDLGAQEVVVVTSWWHSLRAGKLVRAALPDPAVAVRTSSPRSVPSPALLARELVCLMGLPLQTLRLRRASHRSD